MAHRLIVVLAIVAVGAAFPTSAQANHRKVLCGNFSGQGMAPHLARKPARCDVTRYRRGIPAEVMRLRSMNWTRWGARAKGRGSVDGRGGTVVRLRRGRRCGPNGEYRVYSEMKIGSNSWRRILYCGD